MSWWTRLWGTESVMTAPICAIHDEWGAPGLDDLPLTDEEKQLDICPFCKRAQATE